VFPVVVIFNRVDVASPATTLTPAAALVQYVEVGAQAIALTSTVGTAAFAESPANENATLNASNIAILLKNSFFTVNRPSIVISTSV